MSLFHRKKTESPANCKQCRASVASCIINRHPAYRTGTTTTGGGTMGTTTVPCRVWATTHPLVESRMIIHAYKRIIFTSGFLALGMPCGNCSFQYSCGYWSLDSHVKMRKCMNFVAAIAYCIEPTINIRIFSTKRTIYWRHISSSTGIMKDIKTIAFGTVIFTALIVMSAPRAVMAQLPVPPPPTPPATVPAPPQPPATVPAPPPAPAVRVEVPAPAVTVDIGVPDVYVWDGYEYVGVIGAQYYYLGPGDVWLALDPDHLARWHDWEKDHGDWRDHTIRNERYRRDAQGHDHPWHNDHDQDKSPPDSGHDKDHGH